MICTSEETPNAFGFLILSKMDPSRYVESKQAKLTSNRLKLFLISFLVMIILAIIFPNIPNIAHIVCNTPSTQKENIFKNISSSSEKMGQLINASNVVLFVRTMINILWYFSEQPHKVSLY